MESETSERIISFLSNHFEWIIYINVCIVVLFVLFYGVLKLRDISVPKLLFSIIRKIFYAVVIIGQIVLLVMSGYLYWKNYRKPAPELYITRDIKASTLWVKSDLRVYFIDGNVLRSIKVNGNDEEEIIRTDAPLREYHFAPDGRHLVVLTQNDLYLVDAKTKKNWRVDTLKKSSDQESGGESKSVRGSISGIQWAPDSQKFVYEIARWSPFAQQDNVYIYSVEDQVKKAIKSPTRRISSLYWGREGDSLYYLRHEAQDTSLDASAYEVGVFRIPLTTLTPELVTHISYEESSVPIDNLSLRGIDLFLKGSKLSFGRSGKEDLLVSERGSLVGIDEEDNFYFVSHQWFRKRLFKIPRERRFTETPRHQYKGGDLIVSHIRWIPGGRYVIMEHKYWGVLILEPSTGKVGLLIQANGHTFGWYQEQKA